MRKKDSSQISCISASELELQPFLATTDTTVDATADNVKLVARKPDPSDQLPVEPNLSLSV